MMQPAIDMAIAVYALGADGRYRRLPLDGQGRLVSTVLPGFALDPALMWQATLPDGEQIMAMVREVVK